MGSAGLTAAEFAASLDLRVAVVERDRVGGDCLWTGCVPSKALLASAKAAHTIRHADRHGIGTSEPTIDLPTVWRRVRAVQHRSRRPTTTRSGTATWASRSSTGRRPSPAATRSTVDREHACCTLGSSCCAPAAAHWHPDVPGLADAGYLTSETLFELSDPPASIAIIGGGPIGVEMAQAFTRLGITTTIAATRRQDACRATEPQLAEALPTVLRTEGVTVHLRGRQSRRSDLAGGHKIVSATVGDGTAIEVTVDGCSLQPGDGRTSRGSVSSRSGSNRPSRGSRSTSGGVQR